MADYKKIDFTHRLSSYEVRVPNWTGSEDIRAPFAPWAAGGSLPWYQAYNATKHDRHQEFENATFQHTLDAACGLLVLLSAQFESNDFSPSDELLSVGSYGPNARDGMKSGIGGYFRVRYPNDWPNELKYDFDWQSLQNEQDPFDKFDYSCART